MEVMNELLSVTFTVGTCLGYPLSLIELVGIVTGILSVLYAQRLSVLTWVIGLVNAAALFFVFHQVQLYSDMALQLYFGVMSLYGWYRWRKGSIEHASPKALTATKQRWSFVAVILLTTFLTLIVSEIHVLLPALFPYQAAFPLQDAFTAAASVVATVHLARKEIETWILWIAVDVVSIPLYFARGIPFMAALYTLFLLMAISGFRRWHRELARPLEQGQKFAEGANEQPA
jgi:nicotinamide mononucleotide transporter